MDNKYVIKITRAYKQTGNENIHYYHGKSVTNNERAYNTRRNLIETNKFIKEESKKIVKKVEWMYKEDPDNGILLKIEIIDSETLQPVDMDDFKYTRFTRFEIMDI